MRDRRGGSGRDPQRRESHKYSSRCLCLQSGKNAGDPHDGRRSLGNEVQISHAGGGKVSGLTG